MKLSFRKAPFEKKRKFYNYGEVGSPVLPLIDYHSIEGVVCFQQTPHLICAMNQAQTTILTLAI